MKKFVKCLEHYLNKVNYMVIYTITIIMCININIDTHPRRLLSGVCSNCIPQTSVTFHVILRINGTCMRVWVCV